MSSQEKAIWCASEWEQSIVFKTHDLDRKSPDSGELKYKQRQLKRASWC